MAVNVKLVATRKILRIIKLTENSTTKIANKLGRCPLAFHPGEYAYGSVQMYLPQ